MTEEISITVYLHSTLVKYSSDGKKRKEKIVLEAGSTIEGLIRHLGIEEEPAEKILLGLNGRVADLTEELNQGDKVHLMMPISGG